MKHIIRIFAFLFLLIAAGTSARADEKVNVARQGTVRGRIIDAARQTSPPTWMPMPSAAPSIW